MGSADPGKGKTLGHLKKWASALRPYVWSERSKNESHANEAGPAHAVMAALTTTTFG